MKTALAPPLRRLIPQLTGVRLHILWHRAGDVQNPGGVLALCPKAQRRDGAFGGPLERCRRCLQCHWQEAMSAGIEGHRFIGECGAANFCAGLSLDNVRPLTFILQATRPGDRTRFVADFSHAVDLARLILHDLAATAEARLARRALEAALQQLDARGEAARPRAESQRWLLDLADAGAPSSATARARSVVVAMRDFVHEHAHRPIGLGDVAAAMGMNGSYLSALFSQTTGITFHQFVAEVRMTTAKALLRDPRRLVKEVARAAGYASPDAFRHAFKASEGIPPESWRALAAEAGGGRAE